MSEQRVKLNPESIPSNSYKSKQQPQSSDRKRLKPVVSRDAVVSTKSSAVRRAAGKFFSSDAQEVGSYLVEDRLIPGAKKLALDILSMAFFNKPYDREYDRYDGRPSYNYSARYRGRTYSDDRRRERDRDYDRRGPSRDTRQTDYQNIVLLDRRGAEDVVNEMYGMIRQFGSVSVADLKDLVGATSEAIDNSWGWEREADIGIRRIPSGFLIDVAPARYLD